MTLLALITFSKILGFETHCQEHKEDTLEYKECIKLQALADVRLENFYEENERLFKSYILQAQKQEVVDFMNIAYHIYNKLDDDICVDIERLKDMLKSLDST